MSNQFSNMGLSSSKPFQISLSDIIEKSDVIQLVAVVKSLLKSQMIKNVKNIVAKILTLLIKLCLLLYLRKIFKISFLITISKLKVQ